ncbi:hypothetical protein [Neobacillus sp. NPDC093127]|uniref:hypothetical protein n=1 Tax=Neobacillus sp. NPDC093127 TaxID=3364296 RepID=UPI00381F2657
MSKDFYSPFVLTIRIESPKWTYSTLNHSILPKIKDNFNFEELEIKSNEVKFSDGYPIIFCNIDKVGVQICTALKGDDYFRIVSKLLSELDVFACGEIYLSSIELISFLEFKDNNEVVEFFTLNSNEDKFGKIVKSDFAFEIIKNNKHIRLEALYGDTNSYLVIKLITPISFNGKQELNKVLEKSKKFLLKEKSEFVINRLGRVSHR